VAEAHPIFLAVHIRPLLASSAGQKLSGSATPRYGKAPHRRGARADRRALRGSKISKDRRGVRSIQLGALWGPHV